MLGGVDIPFARGLNGWSDGDVLTHAIIDALLGAAALGDIGSHFPSGEARYKDVSSLVLLGEVRNLLAERGWRTGNIDATVIAEQPRLEEFISQIRLKLSQTLGVEVSQISVKASTSSKLGYVGKGEGIEARVVALIENVSG